MNNTSQPYRVLIALTCLVYVASPLEAAPPTFKKIRIGEHRSEACGVADFNNDGKLDIVAGEYWYEAPAWTAHQFRKFERQVADDGKGYRDDFMNAPIDVDGDGHMDVVTACWFAKQLRVYHNTGETGAWPMTPAGTENGNHETGHLCDVDGDGKANEILPDTKQTSWLEPAIVDGKRQLVEYEVSAKAMPFGAGVGDINGDGRQDILRPKAWFEAPADPRKGTWTEHPLSLGGKDGKSGHTAQILVYDINKDGRNDIVASAAHHHGIFWYEQQADNTWTQHTIDDSWTQAHSLSLNDIDQDGDLDLVAGKRFMAHNGNDPDAHGALGVYWYELERSATPAWNKHVISYDEGIGSGVNLCVVDMDNDTDLDVVVTGKWGGPVLFENQAVTKTAE